VRWKTNGELDFLGRTDHQVKVRGFRIETGEIEAAIVKHPGVKESAVVAREDGGRSKYLVAYFVPRGMEAGPVPVSQDLRAALHEQLPEYMQPSAFISLAALPRTPNGKVDRNALPAPDLAEIAKASYVAPANETEKRVLAIWEKVLGISTISTNANFFDVGGHSLLAAQLLARIDQSFGKKIPLAALFQSPTIQQMSELLTGQTRSESMDGVATIQPKGSRTPIFCLHGVPSMRLLADELGQDQPFVTVNLPREARLTRPYRVEEIAAIHLKTIQKIQPEGPYFLAGWCREALLAYEIAQRLNAQGKEVGLVMMFDTWVPGYLSRFNGREARQARSSFEIERILVHVRNLRQTSLARAVRYTWEQLGTIFVDRIRYTKLGLYRLLGFEVGSKNALSTENQDDILLIAVKNYRPKPYDGRVLLFRSDKYRTWRYWDASLGWAHLVPNLKVFAVPGVHDSMLTGPHCPSIARAITEAIDDSVRAAEFVPASETRSWSSADSGIHSNTPTYV
jgi:thioesterase domain-containing protein/acyl carrier protein